ncbi:MAG TPA: diacylglycerol kinase family protein [Coriobacteriia bacterium]
MTQGRHLIIVNPQARRGEADKLTPVIENLLVRLPHDTVETESPGHAVDLAAAASGYDVVVAVGGDGTVHEVLNGLMRHPAEQRPALAVLPTGSGNDTCRTLGIPFDLSDATMLLSTGERRRYDVGSCNGLYFNNSFAAGLDAKVTAKAVEYKVTKQRDGLWLYLTALMHVLFRDLDAFDIRLGFDGAGPETVRTLIIAVTNGATYGGGFKITPFADPTDGVFDVCMIDELGLGEALWRLPFVIAGKHTKMPVVHMSRHTSAVITSDVALPAQLDGEVLLENRYELAMLPGAIECVVPRRDS